MKPHIRSFLSRCGAILFWIFIWLVAAYAVNSQILLASPLDVAKALGRILAGGVLSQVVLFSLVRISVGFLVGFFLGLFLASAAYRWRFVEVLLAPLAATLRSVPIVCVIVLLLMLAGSSAVSVFAVFLAVFPAAYFSMLEALRASDHALDDVLRIFGVPLWRRFFADGWQQVLPDLLGTSRNICGMAWKAGIAAELIGSPPGSIGERIYQAKVLLDTADVLAWTIVVVVLSWLLEHFFTWLLAKSGPAAERLAAIRPGSTRAAKAAEIGVKDATICRGGREVFAGVTVLARPGERIVLRGPSGVGKTSLLMASCGTLPLDAGHAFVPSVLSVMSQHPRLVEGLTAKQNVELVGANGDVEALLTELLPAEAMTRPVSELSGGQRRRVELARALLHPGSAVVLDEPFASLDKNSHERSAAFVRAHLNGRTLLVASHDPSDAALLNAREREF